MKRRIEHQNVAFTSDLHAFHDNVIRHDGRPFSSVDEMNNELIKRWNEVVGKNTEVYFLGDMFMKARSESMKWFVEQLNGKIYFVMGNHDKYKDIKKLDRFEDIYEYGTEIYVKDESIVSGKGNGGYQNIILCHYPILSWNKSHHGSFMLHGHCHQSLVKNPDMEWYYKRKVLDVGCNGWDYKPLTYSRVKEEMDKKVISPVDHHGDSE